jgi:DNA-directed RNA polymerase subunit RPC12/RpoP
METTKEYKCSDCQDKHILMNYNNKGVHICYTCLKRGFLDQSDKEQNNE